MREIYYVKPIDNSRLVPVGDPREHRRYFSMALLVVLWFAALMFSAWQRLEGVQDGYRLETLEREAQQLTEMNRKLRLEEAALGDPVRVDMIARNELGMTNLRPHQIVSGEAGLPAPPVVARVMAEARPERDSLPPQARQVAAVVP
jgi:cell division protein FtsL